MELAVGSSVALCRLGIDQLSSVDSDALRVTFFSPLLWPLSRAAGKNCSHDDRKEVTSGVVEDGWDDWCGRSGRQRASGGKIKM
jgi:hypothetical protein